MRDFELRMPTEFVFGKDAVDKTGDKLAGLGYRSVLVVYGQGSVVKSGTLERVQKSLTAAGIASVELGGVRPNPEVGLVREGIELARGSEGTPVDAVLAVGGGSVIDTAKAIAFGVAYNGDVWDIFLKKASIRAVLPIACVLTIPAAGSEASDSCVISNYADERKLGVNSPDIRPRLAVMDPTLTYTLPPYQTAAGVTDMIAHICERYFSGAEAVPVTDNIATGIIRALIEETPRVMDNPDDYDARANIMWAGMLAHVGLAGCGRNMVYGKRAGGWESHALEHELSAHHPEIAHGAGLAVIMPAWMRYVCGADPERFATFAREVFGLDDANGQMSTEELALAGIDALQEFFALIGMPRTLGAFKLMPSDVNALLPTLEASKGAVFGAFKPLTMDDAKAIYLSAF